MHRLLGPVAAIALTIGALAAAPAAAEPSLVVDGPRGPVLAEVQAPHARTAGLRIGRSYGPVVASASGRILAGRTLRDGAHRLVLGDRHSQRTVALVPVARCLSSVALSRDGSLLTWSAAPQDAAGCAFADVVHLLDVETGTRLDLPAPPRSGWFRTPVTFSPDGSRVVLVGLTPEDRWIMRVFDAATGAQLRELVDHLPTDVPAGRNALVVRRTAGLPGGPRCRLFVLDTRSDVDPTCWDDDLRLTAPQAATLTASPHGRRLAWVASGHGQRHLVLAGVDAPASAREVGRIDTGPGRPSLTWVGSTYLLARSPEDDVRTLVRARTARPVWARPPITYGWVR